MKKLRNKINPYKKRVLWVGILVLSYACSDLLDKGIDNRVHIDTLDKMQDALDGLNPRADFLFTDYMSDDYELRDVAGHVISSVRDDIGNYFTFRVTKESFPSSQYKYSFYYSNPNLSWLRYYYRIQNSALVLDAAKKYETKSESEEIKKNTIIAQASAIRAYCHFMLLSLFAKPYDPATAANDLGIPLVENYTGEAIETYPRKTIKEEYEFVEQELLKAHKLIDDDLIDNNNKQFHFTQISIEAVLARLYLYKKEWKKCIEFADKVIAKKAGKLVNVQALITQYVVKEKKIEDLGKHYFDPDEQESYLLMSEDTLAFQSYFWSGYYPWPLASFFEQNGKQHAGVYYFIWTNPLYADRIPMKVLYYSNSPTGYRNGTFPLLSVDETYYNRAEAYIEDGQLDKAKEDLNLLLTNDAFIQEIGTKISQDQTFISRLSGINDKKELMNYLLDAKRMRFYGEGMRWFDIRRHGLPVTHTNLNGTFTIDGSDPQAYVIMPSLEELDFGGNEYK